MTLKLENKQHLDEMELFGSHGFLLECLDFTHKNSLRNDKCDNTFSKVSKSMESVKNTITQLSDILVSTLV